MLRRYEKNKDKPTNRQKNKVNLKFFNHHLLIFNYYLYLCTRFQAQMAESVDALVSNTSGATHPGSSPGLGTRLKKRILCKKHLAGDF